MLSLCPECLSEDSFLVCRKEPDFICRRANTIAVCSYLSPRSGVNKDYKNKKGNEIFCVVVSDVPTYSQKRNRINEY